MVGRGDAVPHVRKQDPHDHNPYNPLFFNKRFRVVLFRDWLDGVFFLP